MAIVVDNKDGESVDHIVMADDGKGESVNIPTFLIGKSDGQKLKDSIHHNATVSQDPEQARRDKWRNNVVIQAELDLMTKTDKQVKVDLWYADVTELYQTHIQMDRYA